MHHVTCMTHVPWCMLESLTSGFIWSLWWGNVPGIPGACAIRNFTYLVIGPLCGIFVYSPHIDFLIAQCSYIRYFFYHECLKTPLPHNIRPSLLGGWIKGGLNHFIRYLMPLCPFFSLNFVSNIFLLTLELFSLPLCNYAYMQSWFSRKMKAILFESYLHRPDHHPFINSNINQIKIHYNHHPDTQHTPKTKYFVNVG